MTEIVDETREVVVIEQPHQNGAHDFTDAYAPDGHPEFLYCRRCGEVILREPTRVVVPADPEPGLAVAEQQERFKWRANERADRAEAELARLQEPDR